MNKTWFRKLLAVPTLAAFLFVSGCFDDVVGKYQDTGGNKLELKSGGAAIIDMGPLRIEGTYTVDGGKVTVKPAGDPSVNNLILTIESDGSLTPQPNPVFTKFSKAK